MDKKQPIERNVSHTTFGRKVTRSVGKLVATAAATVIALGATSLTSCTLQQEQKFANTTQQIADAIRRAETLAWSPAKFNAFLENYVALIPACQPYIKDAEFAYAAAFTAGNLSVTALESIATKYDVATPPASKTVVAYITGPGDIERRAHARKHQPELLPAIVQATRDDVR